MTFLELTATAPQVSYRNPEVVATFLTHHPEIEPFIKSAWPALVESFDGPVEIVLELLVYPEEIAQEELVGWIQSHDEVGEGLKKFEQFENEWLLDHLAEVDDYFSFNLETL